MDSERVKGERKATWRTYPAASLSQNTDADSHERQCRLLQGENRAKFGTGSARKWWDLDPGGHG